MRLSLSLPVALCALTLAAEARGQARCDEPYAAAEAYFDATEDDFDGVVVRARSVRGCYGQEVPDARLEVYRWEMWGLNNALRYGEAAALADSFLTTHTLDDHYDAYLYVLREGGNALAQTGRTAQGVARLQRALALLPATRVRERAATLSHLAYVYLQRGDFPEGYRLLQERRALVEHHTTGGARAAARARALTELSEGISTWYEEGGLTDPILLDSGLAYARTALALARTHDLAFFEALAGLRVGDFLSFAGRHAEADAAYAAAIERLPPDHSRQSFLWLYRARAAVRAGRFGEAETTLHRVLRMPTTAAEREVQWTAWETLGALHERQRHLPEAEAAYRAAIAAAERYRAGQGSGDSWSRMVGVLQRPSRGLVRVLVDQNRPAEALAALDGARARHLLDLQLRARRLAADTSAARQADTLFAALSEVRNRLAEPGNAGRPALEARAADLEARVARLFPQAPLSELDPAVLQRVLGGRNATLVSYLLDIGEPGIGRPQRSFAFVVTADTLAVVPLAAHAADAQRLVARVSPALTEADVRGMAARAFQLDALHALYATFVAPVARHLPRGARLVVVPDGALFGVPFAALVARPPGGPYAYTRAAYLGDAHPVAVELAAGLLLAVPEPRTFGYDAVAVGRSRFTEAEGVAPLPGVGRELDAVASAFGRTQTLADEAATEAAFFEDAARGRVLHVATHTEAGSSSPLYAFLRLWPGDGGDGLLYLHELERQPLHNALVVLSGCSTARGALHTGEGMAGLQYGARAGGASSVLATLWLADDRATADVAAAFYRALAGGAPKDVALQQAQRAYRRAHPDASPYAWAAFTLYGDATPLPAPERRFPMRGALALAAAALLGGLAFHFVRTRRARV